MSDATAWLTKAASDLSEAPTKMSEYMKDTAPVKDMDNPPRQNKVFKLSVIDE